jgi:hypothetical protein
MKNSLLVKTLLLAGVMGGGLAARALDIKGFSLSQLGSHRYDAAPEGQPKTDAQNAVDYMYSLGARHVNLTPEARMSDFHSNIIQPLTPLAQRTEERTRLMRLISYIKSKGMTVGLRPIILVERKPGFESKWHGNIQPTDPMAWFDSLRSYLDTYATIARIAGVEEFTVGAELYSMTVGLEDQWPQQPFGFPREWALIVKDLKTKLGAKTRIMYDINYTDETANSDGTGASGGEIERWRYRLVDLKPNPANPRTMDAKSQQAWTQLKDLWLSLDMVGIDMYRSLLPRGQAAPSDYAALVAKLEQRASQFATDIDSKLLDIETAVGAPKRIIIKEIGFKSCSGCFTDPFLYDDARREVNVVHQAASYEAFLNAFVKPNWAWLAGINWWDIAVDPARGGASDPGFTVRGKTQTEEVLKKGWN